MSERDWDMNDVEMVYDGGQLRIYDGWICARLRDGRIVNRWYEGDMRWERTEAFIKDLVAQDVAKALDELFSLGDDDTSGLPAARAAVAKKRKRDE